PAATPRDGESRAFSWTIRLRFDNLSSISKTERPTCNRMQTMMTNDHEPDAGRHALPVIRSDPEKLDGLFAGKRKNFRLEKL
ncbi:hypothetical protein, partial [Burkholderia sp. LMG 13014]|uniref:hypothetical protein n=1 Tax=Burkholderia sp. LMG 13014 TaxID=2709306 RepID=UPI00196321A8